MRPFEGDLAKQNSDSSERKIHSVIDQSLASEDPAGLLSCSE